MILLLIIKFLLGMADLSSDFFAAVCYQRSAITLDLNVVFTIIVRKVSGEELTVTTEANECVVAVKESIQKAWKIPRCQQKLVFDTTVLRNHGTMTEYGIHSQSVVTLVITDSQIDR